MVKKQSLESKEETKCIWKFFSSVWDFKIYEKKFKLSAMFIYLALTLILYTGILYIINNNYRIVEYTFGQILLYSVLTTLLLLFIMHILFYLVINAFIDDSKRKPFWKSCLVNYAIFMPIILVGHIVNLISSIFFMSLTNFYFILTVLISIYAFINFIMNQKNYYGVSFYKSFTSLMFVLTLLAIASMMYVFLGM
jgi:hypothetical protein